MTIYVSNINFRTESDSFQDLFAQYGEVSSARIITDRETGRSRGFGFIDMENDEEANAAIEALNGFEFEGKELNVSEARPREDRGNGGFRRNSYGNNRGGGYDNNRGNGGYGRRNRY